MATTRSTTVQEPPRRKSVAAERPRFPLVLKIFLLTALLILLVVGIAVGITIDRSNRIAKETVNRSISSAAELFRDLERGRLGRLALPTQLLGGDPAFAAYIQDQLSGTPASTDTAAPPTAAEPTSPPGSAPAVPEPTAAPTIDLVSIADQIEQRRQSFGSDLLMLLDDEGRVVIRTDQPAVSAQSRLDLYEISPLVKKVVDDASVEVSSGVLPLGERLYHAAVAPVAIGANRIRTAYLVNAYAIDDQFANRIAETTNAGVMFVAAAKPSAPVSRSANAPSVSMDQMSGVRDIFRTNRVLPPITVRVDQSSYVMTGEPLQSGPQAVGAAVFLRSLDRELAPFKQIERALMIGGGAALLLAFVLSWFIAKRVTRPIEDLARVAQAVTAGDYSVQPKDDQSDEVGILGRSFAKMITALRDKAELEELYAQMSARAEEREEPSRLFEPAKSDEGTILVTDVRGLAAGGDEDAATSISTLERVMRLQEAEIKRQNGMVREIAGHRLVSIFPGDRGIIHAIRAARAMNEDLAAQGNSNLTLGVGIATGQYVTGSVDLTEQSGQAIVGNAPLLAALFAWHAPAGFAYISWETAQTAGGEILSSAQKEDVRLKWLPSPLPVAAFPLISITTSVIRSIGGPADSTAAMSTMRLDGTQPGPTAPPTPSGADLSVGTLFANRYRIEQILGRGGMGVVYKATDTQLDETVAIKTLTGDMLQRSSEDLERFKREIRLARKITHRNVLRTFDYGEAEGNYFISMEFVRGYTLSELLDEAPNRQMSIRVALGIARQICRGLHAAHEQGVIHRDIKPQNVLIDQRGEVKLMDFGIARMAEAKEGMTQAGLIVGTPHYMSPEQVQGKTLGAQSDVYSMGVLIYEMLAGKRPFESSSLTGVLTAHITEQARPPIEIRPEIGRQLNDVVMRALTKDTAKRYADAGDLLADLDRIQVAAAA